MTGLLDSTEDEAYMKLVFITTAWMMIFCFSKIANSYPKQPDANYKACIGKQRGAACSVKVKEKLLEGICKKDLAGKVFCAPKPATPKKKK